MTALLIQHGTYTLGTVLTWAGAGCILGLLIVGWEELGRRQR